MPLKEARDRVFFKILKRSSSSLDELFNTRKIIYNDLISQIVEHFW